MSRLLFSQSRWRGIFAQVSIHRIGVFLVQLAAMPVYLASFLMPKDRCLWVFGAFHGRQFSGNSKYVFLRALAERPGIRPVWISRSHAVVQQVRALGAEAHLANSMRGICLQMRAGAAFINQASGADLVTAAIAGRTVQYQLWHGSPIKKILCDHRETLQGQSDALSRVQAVIFPWRAWKYDYISAASDRVAETLGSAFRCGEVIVSGYPRNDNLPRGEIAQGKAAIRLILFAPTFRGAMFGVNRERREDESLLASGFDVAAMDALLESIGAKLWLRPHPVNLPPPALIKQVERSQHIRFDSSEDIYAMLPEVDLLITDYSSIVFDYMLTGRPVINLAFDLEHYQQTSRELYYRYEQVAVTPEVRTWPQACALIREFCEKGPDAAYIDRYREVRDRFNRHLSGSASDWIVRHAMRTLGIAAEKSPATAPVHSGD